MPFLIRQKMDPPLAPSKYCKRETEMEKIFLLHKHPRCCSVCCFLTKVFFCSKFAFGCHFQFVDESMKFSFLSVFGANSMRILFCSVRWILIRKFTSVDHDLRNTFHGLCTSLALFFHHWSRPDPLNWFARTCQGNIEHVERNLELITRQCYPLVAQNTAVDPFWDHVLYIPCTLVCHLLPKFLDCSGTVCKV